MTVHSATAFRAAVPLPPSVVFQSPVRQVQRVQLPLFASWEPVIYVAGGSGGRFPTRLLHDPHLPASIPEPAPRVARPRPAPLFDEWLPRYLNRHVPFPAAPAKSKLMEDLLAVVLRAVRNAEAVPSNPVLAKLTGAVRQSTARAMRAMEKDGVFTMEVRGHERRILFPDGSATGWGAFRRGHAPGPRGAPPKPKPPRKDNSPPLAVRTPAMPAPTTRPAKACQFVTAGPNFRPRRPEDFDAAMCGAESLAGESWCAAHYVLIFPKSRRARLLETTSLCCS